MKTSQRIYKKTVLRLLFVIVLALFIYISFALLSSSIIILTLRNTGMEYLYPLTKIINKLSLLLIAPALLILFIRNKVNVAEVLTPSLLWFIASFITPLYASVYVEMFVLERLPEGMTKMINAMSLIAISLAVLQTLYLVSKHFRKPLAFFKD